MQIAKSTICGKSIRNLGPLESGCKLVIVLGRANEKKRSVLLESLAQHIHTHGYSVCWFESRVIQTAKILDHSFETILNGRLALFCMNCGVFSACIRKITKIAILLTHPSKWDYFLNYNKRLYPDIANELQEFMHTISPAEVYILSQSAGGIIASYIEPNPYVQKIVCFGYPFKHPNMDEELARTINLAKIKKPFLIFQGDADIYGTAKDAQRYPLSSSIQVVSVQDGHDYDNMQQHQYQSCLQMVQALLGLQASYQ